ncbi:MAG: hypothetical protein ACLQNE_25185 [Thermoguttaceae bacterium]|jgi:hypothetical protein
MAEPKVFFVHLRRPDKSNPMERWDNPFYEFGQVHQCLNIDSRISCP